jgi:hypothetical protein
MGYIRKALSIGTLGLSNLVLEDESKQSARPTQTRPRPRKRTKAKAKTRVKASASRSQGEHRTATAKQRPARAKPKAGARTRPTKTSAAKTPAAKTPAAKTPAAKTPAAKTPAARAKSPLAARPEPGSVQPPKPRLGPNPEAPPTATTTARAGATGNGVAIALERIATLHEHGALTDREFAAAKARILGTSSTPGGPEAASATFPAIEANVAAARRIDGYADPDREPSATTTPGAPGGI